LQANAQVQAGAQGQNVVGCATPRVSAIRPVCRSVAPMLTHR
jgi:hypothetical protein